MYQIQTTPGIIIYSRPYGEAGKILSIFTRGFGLVQVTAQGIRFEKSKLRYQTREYSLGDFSLVRGKEYWRLTSAQERSGPRKDNLKFRARICFLVKRLIHGEEPKEEVFEVIGNSFVFMDLETNLTPEQSSTLESLTVARVLHWLGYIGEDGEFNDHVRSLDISPERLDLLKGKRDFLIRHINKALRESQM